MSKVVEFSKLKSDKEEVKDDEIAKLIEQHWNEYKQEARVPDDFKVMTPEEIVEFISNPEHHFVFDTIETAALYANFYLSLPDFDNVLFFDVQPCVSRKSLFHRLVPVFKDGSNAVFVTQDMTNSVVYNEIERHVKEQLNPKDPDPELN